MPEWVFVNTAGTPVNTSHWRVRVFNKIFEREKNLRRVRIHDLRHTYASLLIQEGASLPYIKDQLGHHSISMTVDVYGHLTPGANQAWVDRLDHLAPNGTPVAPKQKRSQPQEANSLFLHGDPKGTRTPVAGVRGRSPRPLDDGAKKYGYVSK